MLGTLLVIGAVTWLVARLTSNPATPAAAPTALPSPSGAPTAFPPVPTGADPRLRVKPTVRVPKTPPARLVVKDLIVGKGTPAAPGKTLTVNYVGLGIPDGVEFDSSWKRRSPFDVVLGQGQVIKGWDLGLAGMRVGGRRELIIPPSLGYGAKGSPPVIRPNESLVFVVDLLAVR